MATSLARHEKQHPLRLAKYTAVVAFILLVIAIVLANSMLKPLGRDEQMYCSAGALLAKGQLVYRDFTYPSQLPYHPLLYASLYKLAGGNGYLLIGRLTSVVANLVTCAMIMLIYREAFAAQRRRAWAFGSAAVLWFLLNPFVDYANGYAWNHDIVTASVLTSVWLFLRLDFERAGKTVLIVGLLTVACWMRITSVLFWLAIVAALLWAARRAGCLKQTLTLTAATTLVLSLWPLWVIFQAPQAFLLNLIAIPKLYGGWLREMGFFHPKGQLTLHVLKHPAMILLLLTAAGVWGLSLSRILRQRHVALMLILPWIALLIAFIPPTMWQQYWAVPVPLILVGCAYPLRSLADRWGEKRWMFGGTSSVLLLLALAANPVPLVRATLLFETWQPLRLQVSRTQGRDGSASRWLSPREEPAPSGTGKRHQRSLRSQAPPSAMLRNAAYVSLRL